MKYKVTITETLSKSVEVEADTPEEAQEIVEEKYYRAKEDEYILGAEDFTGSNFNVELIPSPIKFRIYQVNTDRDKNRIAFMSYDGLEKFQGTKDINSSVYDKVYEGEADLHSLEDIFKKFNFNHPEDYTGRSLSVSDIVEIVSSDDVKPGFYFCDTFGFKEVEFDPSQTSEAQKPETITVVLLEPDKYARITEIRAGLRSYQQLVGGRICSADYFDEGVCVVCNDESKINGMKLNRGVYDEERNLVDVIAGTAFICDCSGEKFGSLSKEQAEKYSDRFRYPERFIKLNDEIKGIPFKPEKNIER